MTIHLNLQTKSSITWEQGPKNQINNHRTKRSQTHIFKGYKQASHSATFGQ